MLRYWTAGESHGKTMLAVVDDEPRLHWDGENTHLGLNAIRAGGLEIHQDLAVELLEDLGGRTVAVAQPGHRPIPAQ